MTLEEAKAKPLGKVGVNKDLISIIGREKAECYPAKMIDMSYVQATLMFVNDEFFKGIEVGALYKILDDDKKMAFIAVMKERGMLVEIEK